MCEHRWAKTLLESCPPANAQAPGNEVLFRNTLANTPDVNDFLSQRETYPDKTFLGVTECETRALSMWSTIERCRALRKLKKFRHTAIAALSLTPDAGAIMRRADGHVAWWCCGAFDPVAASLIVEQAP